LNSQKEAAVLVSQALNLISNHKLFGGSQSQYKHISSECQCEMTFSIYLPPQSSEAVVPVLYWLSGLTCTDENFVSKAGAQRVASELGIAIVMPDTSPRGHDIADDPEGDWDFGLGAGFYVNATQAPFSKHYRMYDYIVSELPQLIEANFPVIENRKSISGHSMGGHGALTIALRNPGVYKSVSAFAPICAPTQCQWGKKAFSGYLGDDKTTWLQHDAVELVKTAKERLPLFIDQGGDDNFLKDQLYPALLKQVCQQYGHPIQLRMQPGYDHSYYFIASFMEDHLRFHAEALKLKGDSSQ